MKTKHFIRCSTIAAVVAVGSAAAVPAFCQTPTSNLRSQPPVGNVPAGQPGFPQPAVGMPNAQFAPMNLPPAQPGGFQQGQPSPGPFTTPTLGGANNNPNGLPPANGFNNPVNNSSNVEARLQVYDLPLEYVGTTGAKLQLLFGNDKRVRITNDPNGGRLMVLAPEPVQQQIAQVVAEIQRQVGSLNYDSRGNIVSNTVQRNAYRLQKVSAKELEDAIARLAGTRLSVNTINNGQTAQLQMVTKDGVQEVMQIDRQTGEVRLQGTPANVLAWSQVITAIDIGQADPARPTQIVPITPATPERIERALKLVRFASYNGQPPQGAAEEETTGTARLGRPQGADDTATVIGSPDSLNSGTGLIGDVDISFVQEMGLVIVKGSKRDVQRVLEVIEQIKKQSVETQPEIQLYPLKHVNGQALEVIISGLNRDVFQPRQGQVSITALGQPNALLLIGRAEALQGIIQLIEKLDQPLDPNSQLRVFRMIHSSAVDAETLIRNFFTDGSSTGGTGTDANARTGLAARIKVVSDFRTNSLIVQASPRDLTEVGKLISEIDVESTSAENEIRVFPVKNAVASELQPILQTAISGQSSSSTTGGQGGQGGGQGGQGSSSSSGSSRATPPSSRLSIVPREGGSVDSGILAGVVVTTNPSINALIVRAPKKSMALIAALIDQLDQLPSADARIKVFEVKNGDATSLALTLQQVFGLPATAGTSTTNAATIGLQNLAALTAGGESSLIPLRVTVDQRTNSIIASGSPTDLEVIEVLLLRLDEQGGQTRSTEVIWLRNSAANDVFTALNSLLTNQRTVINQQLQSGQAISLFEKVDREVFVVAEPSTNSLIISATPRYMTQIRSVIERLDRQQPMIAVEILIAEVTLDDQFDWGSEFGLQDSLLFDRNSASGGTLSSPAFNTGTVLNNTITAGKPGRVAGQGSTGFNMGRTNSGLGYGGLVLAAGSESVNILLRALQDANRVQILSRPQLMTIDNNISVVQVGSQVPTINGTFAGGLGGGVTNSVTYIPVGLIMQIQPRTNQDGLINMIVAVNRSNLGAVEDGIPISFGPNGEAIRSPIINTTLAQTRVTAYDGQTVVLGGLITKNRSTRSRRVPFLADIPIAGALFRFDSEAESRTELLVVMTPRVINFNDPDKLDMIKQVESSRMSWCLGDVLNIHGDVGLSAGNGLWGPAASPVIYPDMQPTCEPEEVEVNGAEMANPPMESMEQLDPPVRLNGANRTLLQTPGAAGQPSVNAATPILNSAYQQPGNASGNGVAPASYTPPVPATGNRQYIPLNPITAPNTGATSGTPAGTNGPAARVAGQPR